MKVEKMALTKEDKEAIIKKVYGKNNPEGYRVRVMQIIDETEKLVVKRILKHISYFEYEEFKQKWLKREK